MPETLSTRRCGLCGTLSDAPLCPDCGHGTVEYEVTLADSDTGSEV
jgi:hypothetical protein